MKERKGKKRVGEGRGREKRRVRVGERVVLGRVGLKLKERKRRKKSRVREGGEG